MSANRPNVGFDPDSPHTGFRVMAKACDECLFSKNRIVPDARAVEVIAQSKDSFFQCHKATMAGIVGGCCKGFFDRGLGFTDTIKAANMPLQLIDPEDL